MSALQRGEEMNLKINVVGLGHPTRWHCSINNDFATKEEAEKLKEEIELAMRIMENTPIIDIKDIEREPTKEEIKSAKEAEDYYLKHEPIHFESKTRLSQHFKSLELHGYITPEWRHEIKIDEHGEKTRAYKIFKINFDKVKKQ